MATQQVNNLQVVHLREGSRLGWLKSSVTRFGKISPKQQNFKSPW